MLPDNPNTPDPLYTEDEAATLMRLPVTWVAKARREHRIPCHRFGRKVFYTAADIQTAIDRAHVEANPDPAGLTARSRAHHNRKAKAS